MLVADTSSCCECGGGGCASWCSGWDRPWTVGLGTGSARVEGGISSIGLFSRAASEVGTGW